MVPSYAHFVARVGGDGISLIPTIPCKVFMVHPPLAMGCMFSEPNSGTIRADIFMRAEPT